jgi:hypothetical protein
MTKNPSAERLNLMATRLGDVPSDKYNGVEQRVIRSDQRVEPSAIIRIVMLIFQQTTKLPRYQCMLRVSSGKP